MWVIARHDNSSIIVGTGKNYRKVLIFRGLGGKRGGTVGATDGGGREEGGGRSSAQVNLNPGET